jgi:hypothetical protein
MWNELLYNFIVYPIVLVMVLLFINIRVFISKYKEQSNFNQEDKYSKSEIFKLISYLYIMIILIITNIIYSSIIYLKIEDLVVNNKDISIFLFSIYLSILLMNIVLYFWWINILKSKNRFAKIFSLTILWISLAEIPAILWLIYIYDIINK